MTNEEVRQLVLAAAKFGWSRHMHPWRKVGSGVMDLLSTGELHKLLNKTDVDMIGEHDESI